MGPEEAASVERNSRALFSLSLRASDGVAGAGDPLRPNSLRALLELDAGPGVSIGQLAEALALSESATSRLVERLVQRGLLRRASSPTDRRQVTITMTAAGRRVVSRLIARRRRSYVAVLERMSPGDRIKLLKGLAAFAAAAGALPAPDRVRRNRE